MFCFKTKQISSLTFWPAPPKAVNREEKEGREVLFKRYFYCTSEVSINSFLYSEMKNNWARKDHEKSEMCTE